MGFQEKMKEKLDQAQDKTSSAVDKAMADMKRKTDERAKAGQESEQQPKNTMQG